MLLYLTSVRYGVIAESVHRPRRTEELEKRGSILLFLKEISFSVCRFQKCEQPKKKRNLKQDNLLVQATVVTC